METLRTFLNDSAFFYVFLTLITYGFGVMLKNKFKHPVFNPLLISTALCIAVILIFKLDAAKYKQGTKFISFLLTPVTVCLAIPLYEQFEKLKDNWLAILLGIISGVVTSLSLVFGMCLAFGLSKPEFIALLPKSITTPIGIAILSSLLYTCSTACRENHCCHSHQGKSLHHCFHIITFILDFILPVLAMA